MLSGEDISDASLEMNEQIASGKSCTGGTEANGGRSEGTGNDESSGASYMEDPKDPVPKDGLCYADFQDGYAMGSLMFGDVMAPYGAMYFDPSAAYDEGAGVVPSTLGSLNPLPNPQYDFDAEMLNDDGSSCDNAGYTPDEAMGIDYRGTPNAMAMQGPPLSSLMHPGPDFYAPPYSLPCQQDGSFALSSSSSSSSSSSTSSSSSQLPCGDATPVTLKAYPPSSSSSSSSLSTSISPSMSVVVPSVSSTSSPLPGAGTRARSTTSNNKSGKGSPGQQQQQQNNTSSGHVVRKYTQRAPRGPESSAMAALDPAVKEFRREKNKRAAREFRDRQKKLLNDLTTRVKDLEAERDGLAIRLQYMENEVKLYKEQINDYRTAMLKFTVSASNNLAHNNNNNIIASGNANDCNEKESDNKT